MLVAIRSRSLARRGRAQKERRAFLVQRRDKGPQRRPFLAAAALAARWALRVLPSALLLPPSPAGCRFSHPERNQSPSRGRTFVVAGVVVRRPDAPGMPAAAAPSRVVRSLQTAAFVESANPISEMCKLAGYGLQASRHVRVARASRGDKRRTYALSDVLGP